MSKRTIVLLLTLFVIGVEASSQTNKSAGELNTLGYRSLKKKDYAAAQKYFREAISLEPTHELANYNLACALSLSGKLQDSVPYLIKAYKVNPVTRSKRIFDDPDLTQLRASPFFDGVLEEMWIQKELGFSATGDFTPVRKSTPSLSNEDMLKRLFIRFLWCRGSNSGIHCPTLRFYENRTVEFEDSGYGSEDDATSFTVDNGRVVLFFPNGTIDTMRFDGNKLFDTHDSLWYECEERSNDCDESGE